MQTAVNSELVLLNWNIGRIIKIQVLNEQKAEYGKSVIKKISTQLTKDYGRGFSQRNLFNMVRLYEVIPDLEILQSVIAKLSWIHLLQIISIEDNIKREFYIKMCALEKWSVRTLKSKIDSMLFERTVISKKPDKLIKQELELLEKEDIMSTELFFRDPYILDFLGLKDVYSEKDLENAILAELENFILEMGTDFAFLARQKRIRIDDEDYYIDLLFYHRKMRRLVVIELKLDKSGIHVAQYLTQMPPKEILEEKLHKAIQRAKLILEQRK
ncbi:MAG: PDDEXK nuclease domain-containing protein [Anaeromicrobium sp.]|uniref:PDDEXK nuclease domain-containing protein n=1 Tax=Anaeromicrobium sp. TaxID=1929132 RepID=UPI0025CE83B7|nr:PDDEXK nuclease domain-containing protein [Anaeromicrobium sp.]MCT4593029.1 PDDEXK nuclease domain-containing protein [Anaeromicrobium sp.]